MNVMLMSVGGSPEPILLAIREKQPEKIIFFVSQDSRLQVFSDILPKLQCSPEMGLVVTEDEEDIGECTFALLREVPKELRKLGCGEIAWPNLIGYTGGTKTMSASLVWTSSRHSCDYIYVGGKAETRTKKGIGVVLSDREKVVSIQNPWDRIAYFEIHDAIELFNGGQYGNAADMLGEMLKRVDAPNAKRFIKALKMVFDGFHAWDIFDHKKAQGLLKSYIQTLHDMAEVAEPFVPGIKVFVEKAADSFEVLKGIKPGQLSDALVRDLLANALRRAEMEQKYEDASARCYAAIEKFGKYMLNLKFGINNNAAQPEQIPAFLREEYVSRYLFRFDENDGSVTEKLRFGLAATYKLLAALDHVLGKRYIEREKVIQNHLESRNHSILAHGIDPVSRHEFEALFDDALYLLNLDRDNIARFPTIGAI